MTGLFALLQNYKSDVLLGSFTTKMLSQKLFKLIFSQTCAETLPYWLVSKYNCLKITWYFLNVTSKQTSILLSEKRWRRRGCVTKKSSGFSCSRPRRESLIRRRKREKRKRMKKGEFRFFWHLICTPIHPRLLGQGRFQPCLMPGYFLLQ